MKNFPDELMYVLVIAAILLFQYVMKRFGPQPPSPQDEPVPEIAAEEQAAPDISPLPAASDTRFGRSAPPEASPALAQRRFSRKALMGNRREAQDAIVIATILGPCRAYEPHELAARGHG